MTKTVLYNGPVETALRVVTLIDAFSPRFLTLEEIRLLDHFVIHAGDAGAPRTLHPPVQGRGNAFTFRSPLLTAALESLERLEIVATDRNGSKTRYGRHGFLPCSAFLESAASPYLTALRETALWLKESTEAKGHDAFFGRLGERMRSLLEEPLEMPDSQKDRFRFLAASYACDIERVAGTEEGANILLDWTLGTGTGSDAPGFEYRTLEAVVEASKRERAMVMAHAKGLKEVMEKAA